jgi:hypothetical protein
MHNSNSNILTQRRANGRTTFCTAGAVATTTLMTQNHSQTLEPTTATATQMIASLLLDKNNHQGLSPRVQHSQHHTGCSDDEPSSKSSFCHESCYRYNAIFLLQKYKRLISVASLFILFISMVGFTSSWHFFYNNNTDKSNPLRITFSTAPNTKQKPIAMPPIPLYGPAGPYYGHLYFESLRYMASSSSLFQRFIDPDDDLLYDYDFETNLYESDAYVDAEFEPFADIAHHHNPHGCHRLAWADTHHPTCNAFHELSLASEPAMDPLQTYERRYLAHGFYRDTWLLYDPSNKSNAAVLKALRFTNEYLDYTIDVAKKMYTEALIMERTSAHDSTMNMYSHCATSLLVEPAYELSQRIVRGVEYNGRGRITQADLDQAWKHQIVPRNNFTAPEKLDIAIQMAQGIAVMHGHAEGVVLNDDVHPDQWLINHDGMVKFNDFSTSNCDYVVGQTLSSDGIQSQYCSMAHTVAFFL